MPYGKKAGPTFAVVTSVCEKKGFKDFKAGTPGDDCRKALAEHIAKNGLVKPRK